MNDQNQTQIAKENEQEGKEKKTYGVGSFILYTLFAFFGLAFGNGFLPEQKYSSFWQAFLIVLIAILVSALAAGIVCLWKKPFRESFFRYYSRGVKWAVCLMLVVIAINAICSKIPGNPLNPTTQKQSEASPPPPITRKEIDKTVSEMESMHQQGPKQTPHFTDKSKGRMAFSQALAQGVNDQAEQYIQALYNVDGPQIFAPENLRNEESFTRAKAFLLRSQSIINDYRERTKKLLSHFPDRISEFIDPSSPDYLTSKAGAEQRCINILTHMNQFWDLQEQYWQVLGESLNHRKDTLSSSEIKDGQLVFHNTADLEKSEKFAAKIDAINQQIHTTLQDASDELSKDIQPLKK